MGRHRGTPSSGEEEGTGEKADMRWLVAVRGGRGAGERESKQVSRKGSDTHGCHCLLYVLGRVAYFSSCTYLFGAQRISQHASQHTTQGAQASHARRSSSSLRRR